MNLRRRRGTLLGLAIVLVAIVVTGWLALSGRVDWLAQFAKPRIERALLAAGVEADELDIADLSLKGGRVEHALMRFEGGTIEVHGLQISLGIGNLAARRAGAVSVDRLDVELTDLSPGARGAGGVSGDDLPFESIDVREWLIEAPWGDTTIRASGSLRATPGEDGVVRFDGDFTADEGKGRFAGEFDTNSQSLVVRVEDASIAPEGLLAILKSLPEGSVPVGLSFGWELARMSAELLVKPGEPAQAKTSVQLVRGEGSIGDTKGRIETATLEVQWKDGEAMAFELDAEAVALHNGSTQLAADTMQFIGGVEGGSVSLGRAVVTSGEREVRGHGLGSFQLGEDGAGDSAEGTLILESAKFDGFTAGEAEIALHWKEGVLLASTSELKFGGRMEAEIESLELTLTDVAGDSPGVSGRVVAAVDLASALPKDTEVTPALERVTASFHGLLGEGRESMRVEFALADAPRTIKSPNFGGGFTGALTGVVTLDASHVSSSVAGEWKDVSVAIAGQGSATFPEAKLKWSTGRVWTDAIRNWAEIEPARALRELLWVSTIDLRASGGEVDLGDLGSARDVSATLASDGADISEQAGGSLVVSAKSVNAADRLFADFGAILGFGLDGGTVVADIALASPRIPVRARQVVGWSDGFSLDGSYSTDNVDLASLGSFGGLAAAFEGVTGSGTASVSGPLRLGSRGIEAGARVELESVGLVWPGDKVSLAGVSGVIDLDSLEPLHADAGQKLSIGSAKMQDVEFTDGTVEFGIPSPDSVSVTRLEAQALGGKIAATPFEFDPESPKAETSVQLDGVRLEQMLGFFPDVPARAEGGIVGVVPVSWDGQDVVFGNGFIDLQPGELGRVWFDYDIRMLSGGREDQRMLYPVLRRVEKAIRELHFNRLRIDLYPEGAPGRSMQIRLAGVTATEDVHAPVELEINVNAPLERFVKWGTNSVKP
ncbi:MAG TPA: YdbH domain-containing protein [Opitutaceae bacterium]|nr:YdbH domain-containing protein [Opitutaceae bacterium]